MKEIQYYTLWCSHVVANFHPTTAFNCFRYLLHLVLKLQGNKLNINCCMHANFWGIGCYVLETKPLDLKHFCIATRDATIVIKYSKANISYCGISNRYNSIIMWFCGGNYDTSNNYIDRCHLKHTWYYNIC